MPQRLPPIYEIPEVLQQYLEAKLEGKPRVERRLYRNLIGFAPKHLEILTSTDMQPSDMTRLRLPVSAGGDNALSGTATETGFTTGGRPGRRRSSLRVRAPLASNWPGTEHLMSAPAVLNAASPPPAVVSAALPLPPTPPLAVAAALTKASQSLAPPPSAAKSPSPPPTAASAAKPSVSSLTPAAVPAKSSSTTPAVRTIPKSKRKTGFKWDRQFDFLK